MTEIELCHVCGNPTDRAGEGDDSIYCSVCGGGPLCDNCVAAVTGECEACWNAQASEDIDAYLIAHGYDPEAVAARGRAVVRKALVEVVKGIPASVAPGISPKLNNGRWKRLNGKLL